VRRGRRFGARSGPQNVGKMERRIATLEIRAFIIGSY
jgi:hypothetical protein